MNSTKALGRFQLGLRRRQLRIQIGRFDGRQYLSFLHMIADIGVPFGNISIDAGIDDAFIPCGSFAGQCQGKRRRARFCTVTTSTTGGAEAAFAVASAKSVSSSDFR